MAQLSLYELLSAEQTGDVSVNTVDMMLKISYQVEDIVIDNELPVDFFAGFQRFSHFRHQNQRYHRLAQVARRVYVFGEADITPPTIPGVQFIPLAPGDPLIREWFLVVNTPSFFTALLTQEMPGADPIRGDRRFRGLWTYDEQVISNAYLLLSQLLRLPYRPVTQRDYRTQNQYLVRMSNKLVQYSEAATLDLAQSENTVTMLAQVAQEVGGSGTLDAILPTVAVALQQALLSQTIRIYLQESDGTGLRLAASAGGNGPVPPTLHGDGGIIGEAVAAGRPVVIPDTLEAGEYDPLDPTVLSLAAVPLQAGAQTLGALVIGRAMVNGFDDLSLRLLTAVAAQVSLAVERAAQMGERERLERLLQIMLATSTDGVITTDAGGAILALNSVASPGQRAAPPSAGAGQCGP